MKKRGLVTALLVATMALATTFTSLAGEWKQDTTGWWYVNDDGSYTNSKWQQIDGQWYYFDSNSYMSTAWNWIDGKWYHMQDSGVMDANITYETGYLGADGAWVSTKTPVNMISATEEDIIYWDNMQVKYGIDGLTYVAEGNGKYVYAAIMDTNIAIPDYENVFKSKACEDFNGFSSALNWAGNQITFAVWPIDSY